MYMLVRPSLSLIPHSMSGIKSQLCWIFIWIGCAIVHCTLVQQGSIFVQDRQWIFDLGFTMGKQLIALLAKMHFKSDLVLIKLIELHAWNVSHKNVECHRTAAKNIWPLTAVGHHCTYIYLTLFFKIEYCWQLPRTIPDIFHRRHGHTHVNFYRFKAKNWKFTV